MNHLQAFLLGVIQGLTEFLPVSSSGHLRIAETLMGLQNQDLLFFEISCHAGTLCALLLFFRKKWSHLNAKILLFVCVATLPLVPLAFFLQPLKVLFLNPLLLGYAFLITALILWLGTHFTLFSAKNSFGALWIGLFQALALFPGISRSGATISAARLIGWRKEEAFFFSFLLAIPAILGGLLIEGIHVYHMHHVAFSWNNLLLGSTTSFVCGFYALYLLSRILEKLAWFSLYLVFIAIFWFFYVS